MSRPFASTGRQIALSLETKPGESLMGYLCRLADWNVVQNPWTLIGEASCWPPLHLTSTDRLRLAVRLGCEPKRLEELFHCSHGAGPGEGERTWRRRRVAPLSLRRSSHHRAIWQVTSLPFCMETWGAVIEKCPVCEAVLTWRTASIERCQTCGLDLKTVDTPQAEPCDREELAMIGRLLTDGRPLPIDEWSEKVLTGVELFQLIVIVGRAVAPARRDDLPSLKANQILSGLRVLIEHPGSMEALASTGKNETRHPFFSRLAASRSNRTGRVREAIQELLKYRPIEGGIVSLREARMVQGLMTATDVAATLRIERAVLRRLIDQGLLGVRKPRGCVRRYDWFSHDDLDQARKVVASRICARTWAVQSGLTDVDVAQLLAMGLLVEPRDDRIKETFEGLQLDAAEAARLAEQVETCAGAGNAGPDWVAVAEVFLGVGGGYKPWGLLLESALHGLLPHGLGWPERGGFKIGKVRIHPEAVEWLQGASLSPGAIRPFSPDVFGGYRPKALSWGETETLLNCFPADVARLLDLGLIRRSETATSGFSARSVEAFGRAQISASELARVLRLNPRGLDRRMINAGWPRSETGFWPREIIPKAIRVCFRPSDEKNRVRRARRQVELQTQILAKREVVLSAVIVGRRTSSAKSAREEASAQLKAPEVTKCR